MSNHYLPTLRFLFLAALCLSPGRAVLSQDSPWPPGWTQVEPGQTVSGVRYAKDGKILSGNTLAATCRPDRFQVLLSAPSPQRGLAVLICHNDAGDLEKAYILDTRHSRASSLNLGPWGIGIWVSWSPNESHAQIDMGAEDGPPNMFLIDLRTFFKKEIRFKRFDREGENQGFDSNSVSWINDNSFRVRLYTYCDGNYMGKVPCDDRAQRSYLARVNLVPFSISYSNIPQVPATRLMQHPSGATLRRRGGIRHVDFHNFSYRRESKSSSNVFGVPVDARTIVLHDGKATSSAADLCEPSHLVSVKYVDFTGDGREEALVVIHSPAEQCIEWADYFVFAYSDGAPVQIFHQCRFEPLRIRVVRKSLIVTAPLWRENDVRSTPSAMETSIYKWQRNGFVRTADKLVPAR